MPAGLTDVLEEARRLGFLGPGPVAAHVDHARRFGSALFEGWARTEPTVADLGAGGGVPSLPMALRWTDARFVLVDSAAKRTGFLVWAALELGIGDRVEVWRGRAEAFAHLPDRRGAFDAVVARGFGPPATTIECAAPLLGDGGRCVVSEPPEKRRWPPEALAQVGLAELTPVPGFARFARVGDVGSEYPRSSKLMRRAPLFG